jgi:DNA repair protein RadC
VELVRDGTELYKPVTLSRPQDVYEFLSNVRSSDRESLYSFMLDASNHVVGCEEVSRGSLNTTRTHPREIYKSAILSNALGIILGHNHPSGCLEPSTEDVEFTRAIGRAGEIMGVELYDHVIVTDGGYTSLRERGLL